MPDNNAEKKDKNKDEKKWYEDKKIRTMNNKIWFAENNNTINSNESINCKICQFESKKCIEDNLNKINFKPFKWNNLEFIKRNIKLKYYGSIINSINKYLAASNKYELDMMKYYLSGKFITNDNKYISNLLICNTKKYLENNIENKILNEKFKKIIGMNLSDIKEPNLDFYQKYNFHLKKIQEKQTKDFEKKLKYAGFVIRTHKSKIEITEKQSKKIKSWMKDAEIVYNLCIKYHKEDPKFPKDFKIAKQYIFSKFDNINKTPIDILVYEIKDFYANLKSCISNLENGNVKDFEMKDKNTKKMQTITIYNKCISNNGIYIRHLKKIKNFSEIFNKYKSPFEKKLTMDCKLTFDKIKNNYYIYIPFYRKCTETINDNNINVCALDPGEKVFITYYSLNDYGLIGNDIKKPLLKIREKIAKYQKILKGEKNKKGEKINKNKIRKKINKLYRKITGIVNEMHKKTALHLCKKYNIILIPEFNTKDMICDKVQEKIENNNNILDNRKSNRKKKRLNKKVKFVLNQLSHYKFKQQLFSKAEEYGRLCVEVTEEYTSQFCSKCNKISKKYNGRTKECVHCGSKINRDVNGARNILLKNIFKHIR